MRITSKGQVTIPAKVRRELGLAPGTEVEFFLKDGELHLARAGTARSACLEPVRPESAQRPEGTTEERLPGETRGQGLLRRLRGSATDKSMTTDEIIAMTRGA